MTYSNIKTLVLFVFGLLSFEVSAQVSIGDPGFPLSSPNDCGADITFTDQGGGANYTANYNGSITFCPQLDCASSLAPTPATGGSKMTITFATNAGFVWDVHSSDSVYVYDGPDATAPLLGVHNSDTDPTGFTYTASWNNPTGCLTVVFVSDGAIEGAGWQANVSCGYVPQPFEPHLEAYLNGQGANVLNPLDTGFVDMCLGDSILFVAKPNFPNSCETNGYGYNQNTDNISFDWTISSGASFPNNDSIWFVPPARTGYLIDVQMTDIFPYTARLVAKVRISQQPIFAGTGPVKDTVCVGDYTNLIGGVTATDTVGVDIPLGTFQLGGAFAGLTYLPDGSGAQYQAPIDISGFPAGSVISNAQDLNKVCITMEHSYIGDIEIALECPNGTQVTLLNSYGPGFIPGGTSGGGIYLGDPIDDSGGGGPGEGWEYCFSSVFNTWGDYPTELANANFAPAVNFGGGGNSMNPNGVYLPEQSFADFAGCPINGQWTVIVQDNLGIDDGYIFQWGLFFDGSFFPDSYSYQNTIVQDSWTDHPTIVSGQEDTVLVVQPDSPGQYNYTYNVTDNFGCEYDTTVTFTVLPTPSIFPDTIICNQMYVVASNTVANDLGVAWYSNHEEIVFTDTTTLLPGIQASEPGVYTVNMIGFRCQDTVSTTITFPHHIQLSVSDTTICAGGTTSLLASVQHQDNLVWNTGETTNPIMGSAGQTYEVTASNHCYSETASATISEKLCDVEAPNVISLSSTTGNNLWYVKQSGLKDFKCSILNRWGNVVYEFSDPSGAWDGKGPNGQFVAEGTYFYNITTTTETGEEIKKHGFIQVVR